MMKMGRWLMGLMMVVMLPAFGALDVQAAKTFKIGVIMPLTGQLSPDGTQ